MGVTLGMCLRTLLVRLGISAMLAESAILFTWLKYTGAAYLWYLGIQAMIRCYLR